ncbi:uncharacterized protein LOC129286478 [Prosopis cineraria]|uniref:uncharacterized protein LOC129286478 n=1 Tax=Prosopis cineraria TaxID=364024 RepID=UPI00240FC95A|nr:uncharacterized protein LOC129286478 [Prosopis cineraria]
MIIGPIRAPQCSRCGRHHTGECWTCFKYHKVRHITRYCPENAPHTYQRSTILGCVFSMTREEDEVSPKLIRGMFSLSNQYSFALFNSNATHSFVFDEYAKRLSLHVVEIPFMINVSTPVSASIRTSRAYLKVELKFGEIVTSKDGFITSVQVTTANDEIAQLVSVTTSENPKFLSAIQVEKSVREGCQTFLVFCSVHGVYDSALDKIGVVNEFPEVFANEVSGLPPKREIEFSIDLVPSTKPISKAPYRIAPTELNKLKKQLEELSEKGLIRPSVYLRVCLFYLSGRKMAV